MGSKKKVNSHNSGKNGLKMFVVVVVVVVTCSCHMIKKLNCQILNQTFFFFFRLFLLMSGRYSGFFLSTSPGPQCPSPSTQILSYPL